MKKICLFLLISLSLFACSKDPMDRTIFVPDKEDPILPAYTEWGYNSFGANYERDYFLATQDISPCKIVYENNELQFSLHGRMRGDNQRTTLMFTFPSDTMFDFSNLIQLNNKIINLSDAACTVKMLSNNDEKTLDVSSGRLHFKRAQLLRIDSKVNRVILSGTFDLTFLQSVFPESLSDGRFDVGINRQNFYTYE